MPNVKSDNKKTETEHGEQAGKSNEQSAEKEDRPQKRKLPEPPGNLKKRAEWFKKRH